MLGGCKPLLTVLELSHQTNQGQNMTNTIHYNMAAAAEVRSKLVAHCMTANLEETPDHILVYFPPGYQLDGVRVSMANGKKWAYEKALEKAEQTWQQKCHLGSNWNK
jgi:hypothetical protein